MRFTAIIDLAALIWDEKLFLQNETQFYPVIESVPIILNLIVTNKIPTAFRDELLTEVKTYFPYNSIPKQFQDFKLTTIRQLTKLHTIEYVSSLDTEISCTPSLIRNHFADSTQLELKYLISHLYKDNESNQKLLTFSILWEEHVNMVLQKETSKEIEVLICDDRDNHEKAINSLRKIFEHNPKHKLEESIAGNGESAAALRCYNHGLKDKRQAQEILDNSVYVEGSFYGYDYEHKTYIKFVKTNGNIFHGYEVIPDKKLEEKIKNASDNG